MVEQYSGKEKQSKAKKEPSKVSEFLEILQEIRVFMVEGVGHRLSNTSRLYDQMNRVVNDIEKMLNRHSNLPVRLPISATFEQPDGLPPESISMFWSDNNQVVNLMARVNGTYFLKAGEISELLLITQGGEQGFAARAASRKASALRHWNSATRSQIIAGELFYTERVDVWDVWTARKLLSTLKRLRRQLKASGQTEAESVQFYDQIYDCVTTLASHDEHEDGQGTTLAQALRQIADAGGATHGFKNHNRRALEQLLTMFPEREQNVRLYGARVEFTQELIGDHSILVANSYDEQDVVDQALFLTQALDLDAWYRMAVEHAPDNRAQIKTVYLEISNEGRSGYHASVVAEFDDQGNLVKLFQPQRGRKPAVNFLESHDSPRQVQIFIDWLKAIADNPNQPSREQVYPDRDFGYEVVENGQVRITTSGQQQLEAWLAARPRHSRKIARIIDLLRQNNWQVKRKIGADGELVVPDETASDEQMSLDQLFEKTKNY